VSKWATTKRKRRTKTGLSRETLKKKRVYLKVFKRDKFTCRICGTKDTDFEAHHLVPFSHDAVLRGDLINFVCVCKKCHLQKCHIGDFHSVNLEVSARLLLENIKRRRTIPHRKAYLSYFERFGTIFSALVESLRLKRETKNARLK
jgi:hypothetical protein